MDTRAWGLVLVMMGCTDDESPGARSPAPDAAATSERDPASEAGSPNEDTTSHPTNTADASTDDTLAPAVTPPTTTQSDAGSTLPPPHDWPVPETTFTLPKPAEEGSELYFPDVVAAYPDVDFATLDRLYLPAGTYRSVMLGGLPERSTERPLVITNSGGQVRVGGDAANYVFAINGGKNWVLTGRYDEELQTGDPAYVGHAAGYAHSQGKYGIFIDDEFSKEGLTGLSIGGGATDFEVEMLEITRAEFAGIVAKTDNDGAATMHNVSLHDTYVHDVGSEGIYFGSTQAQPQHTFEHLRIYANRLIRTGTEALQVGQLGEGCEIHHNVLGPAAIRWRSAFQRYQDGNVQYGQRHGSSRFHHNIVVGTGDLFVEFFPQPVEGDSHGASDAVTFDHNYFSDSSSSGVYTHADANSVNVVFSANLFRGFDFNYDEVYPDATPPNQVFGIGSNTVNPHLLKDNRFDASFVFVEWTFESTTIDNNVQETLPALEFADFMGDELDENFRRLEWWAERATLSPNQDEVTYAAGAWVMHQGTLYRALTENRATPPNTAPDVWEALPAPADDPRVAPNSPYAKLELGLPPL
jgi:hypothetical protein